MRTLLIVLATVLALLQAHGAMAQPAAPPPEDLRALAEILRKPEMQAWLQAQGGRPTTPAPPVAAGMEQQITVMGGDMEMAMAGTLDEVRDFLHALVAEAPSLPGELAKGSANLAGELQRHGPVTVLFLLAVFAGLGFGVEYAIWWLTTPFRQRIIATPLDTVRDRLRAVGLRTLYGISILLSFALGSIGAFLLFDWPPLLRHVILGYLQVFLIIRLILVLGRVLLAPAAPKFRIVPMSTQAAQFWFTWSAVLVGWFFFTRTSVGILAMLGVAPTAIWLVGLLMGLILLGLTIVAVWLHPDDESGTALTSSRVGRGLITAYLVVVWLLLLTGSVTPFYIGVVLLLLPILIRATHRGVNHILRPPGSAEVEDAAPSILAASLERGLRAVLIIGAAYMVARLLQLDLAGTMAGETLATRLIKGAVNAAIIILIADFGWHIARTWIDRALLHSQPGADGDAEAIRKQARLRTLLPVLRNVLMVVLMVMTALMILSSMGVEIGPLIAGAGVVGVAIGFGAQTLVRDIISGFFYLLDDAFRVGEYVISGTYKGTVESFSLRSVKLRHHRGPLYTVPFGALGAVQNMSRDWVIDKIAVNVVYDTDLVKVKRLIKQVGKELQADEEFAPDIIETLKMQGVDSFGDFAMVVRMKMMTKPGKQFTIRRRAYAMIRQSFAENGVRIAMPTVNVAGGDPGATLAAAAASQSTMPPTPEAA